MEKWWTDDQISTKEFYSFEKRTKEGGKRKEKKKRKKFRSRMLGLLLIKAIHGFHGVPFSLSLSRWDEEEQREEEGEEEEEKEEENASGFRERITDQLSASI